MQPRASTSVTACHSAGIVPYRSTVERRNEIANSDLCFLMCLCNHLAIWMKNHATRIGMRLIQSCNATGFNSVLKSNRYLLTPWRCVQLSATAANQTLSPQQSLTILKTVCLIYKPEIALALTPFAEACTLRGKIGFCHRRDFILTKI